MSPRSESEMLAEKHPIDVSWQSLIHDLGESDTEIVRQAWLTYVSGRFIDDEDRTDRSAFLFLDWVRHQIASGTEFTHSARTDLRDYCDRLMSALETLQGSTQDDNPYLTIEAARQISTWLRGCFHVGAAVWAYHSLTTRPSRPAPRDAGRMKQGATSQDKVLEWLCRASACFQLAMSDEEPGRLYEGGDFPCLVGPSDLSGLLARIHEYWNSEQQRPFYAESIEVINHLSRHLLPSIAHETWDGSASTDLLLLANHQDRLIPVKATLHVKHRTGGKGSLIYPDPVDNGVLAFDHDWKAAQRRVATFLQSLNSVKTLCWSLRFHDLESAKDVAGKFPRSLQEPAFASRFRRPLEVAGDSAGGAFALLVKTISEGLAVDTERSLMICSVDETGVLRRVEEFAKISEQQSRLSWMERPRYLVFSSDITAATTKWLDDNIGISDYFTVKTIEEAIKKLQSLTIAPTVDSAGQSPDHTAVQPHGSSFKNVFGKICQRLKVKGKGQRLGQSCLLVSIAFGLFAASVSNRFGSSDSQLGIRNKSQQEFTLPTSITLEPAPISEYTPVHPVLDSLVDVENLGLSADEFRELQAYTGEENPALGGKASFLVGELPKGQGRSVSLTVKEDLSGKRWRWIFTTGAESSPGQGAYCRDQVVAGLDLKTTTVFLMIFDTNGQFPDEITVLVSEVD